jgi:hypothetical protein
MHKYTLVESGSVKRKDCVFRTRWRPRACLICRVPWLRVLSSRLAQAATAFKEVRYRRPTVMLSGAARDFGQRGESRARSRGPVLRPAEGIPKCVGSKCCVREFYPGTVPENVFCSGDGQPQVMSGEFPEDASTSLSFSGSFDSALETVIPRTVSRGAPLKMTVAKGFAKTTEFRKRFGARVRELRTRRTCCKVTWPTRWACGILHLPHREREERDVLGRNRHA